MRRHVLYICIVGLISLLIPVFAIAEIEYSGACGNGVTWTLDDMGLLTISGSGYMTSSPWNDYSSQYSEVIIKNGVKNICKEAFYGSLVSKVTIPNSVKSIGENAFFRCKRIERVSIPQSVTDIYNCAFFACSKLNSVTLNNGLENIYPQAFGECTALSNISIPASVSFIGYCAFKNSGIKTISIPYGVEQIDYGLFSGCSYLSSITIPNSVTSISGESFLDCTSLKKINIPNSVTTIGSWAFSGCTNLTNVDIPQSVQTIEVAAFYNCYNLKTVVIHGVVSIYDDTFRNCYELTSLTLPACNAESIKILKDNGFSNVLNISPHMNIITDKLTPPTETQTGLTEGKHCSVCKEVIVKQKPIPALKDMSVLYLPASLTTVEREAFSNSKCQAIIISKGCTAIKSHAFSGCKRLLYVYIPRSVTSIASDAFENCNAEAVIFKDTK